MSRKKSLIFYYIILLMILQVVTVNGGSVIAITGQQEVTIASRCDTIKENLRKVQKEDAKTRVYLGGYYETILTKYITPLNVRLVENNMSSVGLVENQNNFVEARTVFVNDFIVYQQGLEELVGIDCKNEPSKFYDKLKKVQQKRKVMVQDTLKMRDLVSDNIKLVMNLRGRIQ